MELNVNTYDPNLLVKTIGNAFNTKTKTEYTEECLLIPKKIGEGRILGFNFSDGVGLLLFDCSFKQKLTLTFNEALLSPLLFNFISTGEITHISNHENNYHTLNSLQSTITANPTDSSEVLIFQPKERIVFSCILIDRKKFKQKIDAGLGDIPEKVKSIFLDTANEKSFFYQTNYSMASSIHLQAVINSEHIDLAKSVYLEGITLELLSNQIKQFKNSVSTTPKKRTVLNNDDIEKILEAKELLLENIEESPTIESLATKVGVNQTKLKIGFKNIFDKPIKTWLRHQKLEKAQLLLLQDQMGIKEISETVGYLNQSHFSRQFKTRYGVLPKDYLKQIKKARTVEMR